MPITPTPTVRPRRLLATLAGLALALPLAASPGAAAPADAVPDPVPLAPARLARGADVAVPHVEGTTVVDGATRIPVRAGSVHLLGASGRAYVVVVADGHGLGARVVRLRRDGSRTRLLRSVNAWTTVLSADGERLIAADDYRAGRTRVRAWSARTGDLVATRRFRGSITVLDASGSRVVLGAWAPSRTLRWNTRTGTARVLSDRVTGTASIRADRLQTYTADPYVGGCAVVSRLSRPDVELWRSCRERVTAFSADGARMATIDLLSDGAGPQQVWNRTGSGRLLATYTTRGWFGAIGWEDDATLLLDTFGARQRATVRCVDERCERASDLTPRVGP